MLVGAGAGAGAVVVLFRINLARGSNAITIALLYSSTVERAGQDGIVYTHWAGRQTSTV